MLSFFQSRPPVRPSTTIEDDPTPTTRAAATPKPTGQFSPKQIRAILVLATAGILLFMIATNKTTSRKASAQTREVQDTAAARNNGGAMATRNYGNDVNLTLKSGPTATPPPYPYSGGQQQGFPPAPTAYGGPAVPYTQPGFAYPPSSLQQGFPQAYPQLPVSPSVPYGAAPSPQPQRDPQEEMRATMQAADDKHEHDSLSAGLIVRSERIDHPTPTVAAAPPPATSTATSTALPNRASSTVPATHPARPPLVPPPAPSDDLPGRQAHTPRADQSALNNATGPTYRLFEGTIIETVLLNRLNSSFTGPVECMVTTDLWSHNREHLIIPQGTKVIGEARRVTHIGQDRLAVVFHRILMPDGYSVSLDTFTGLNQIGETGLNDQVNHHYVQLFGVSIALGAISAIASRGTTSAATPSSGDTFRQGFSQQLSQESTQILDRFLNVLPTVIVREGLRVKVYLSDDLSLPAYDRHRMPSDL
jgi:type IV secretion system protein VirB10